MAGFSGICDLYGFYYQQTRFLSDYSDRVRAERERLDERDLLKRKNSKTDKPAKIESILESSEKPNPSQLLFNFEV